TGGGPALTLTRIRLAFFSMESAGGSCWKTTSSAQSIVSSRSTSCITNPACVASARASPDFRPTRLGTLVEIGVAVRVGVIVCVLVGVVVAVRVGVLVGMIGVGVGLGTMPLGLRKEEIAGPNQTAVASRAANRPITSSATPTATQPALPDCIRIFVGRIATDAGAAR